MKALFRPRTNFRGFEGQDSCKSCGQTAIRPLLLRSLANIRPMFIVCGVEAIPITPENQLAAHNAPWEKQWLRPRYLQNGPTQILSDITKLRWTLIKIVEMANSSMLPTQKS